MKKIILCGSMNPLNKGDQSRIKATLNQLKGNPEISFAILSHSYDKDRAVYAGDGVEIVKAPWSSERIKLAKMAFVSGLTFIKYLSIGFARKLGIKVKAKLYQYDAMVIASGIDFSDYAGRWPVYYCFYLIALFNIVLGKPVMCYAQSMGPIESKVIRYLTKYFLNRVNIISVRDDTSICFLKELKVGKPEIHYMPDPAFFLPRPEIPGAALCDYHLQNSRPLIGLSLNPSPFAGPGTGYCTVGLWYKLNKKNIVKLTEEYTRRMVRICVRLIETYGADLIFIPTCTAYGDNDQIIIDRIRERLSSYNGNTYTVNGASLFESMDTIGACDLFIGLRLHGCIMAAVMGVPLVPMVGTDGPRIPGIMNTLGLKKYTCNIMTADEGRILSIIDEVWNSRQETKKELQSRVMAARKKALEKLVLFQKLCSSG